MITEAQNKEIHQFFKLIQVREQEVYDEFYDHVVSDYESQGFAESGMDMKHYLQQEFLPAFGGTEGIKKIIKSRNKHTQTIYRAQFKSNFRSYFRWPMILVAFSLYLIFYKAFQLFEVKEVFVWSLILATGVPILLGMAGYLSFMINCKIQKKPYYSSIKNNGVLVHILIISWLAQVPNWLKMLFGEDYLISSTSTPTPIIMALMSIGLTLMVIVTLAYLKLMRQNFEFKLSTYEAG